MAISDVLRMLHARSFRFSMTRLRRHLRIRDCGGNGGCAQNANPGRSASDAGLGLVPCGA